MSLVKGYKSEKLAKDFLMQEGLSFKESNFRCLLGEIDLIMQDKDYIVFVEVRARSSLAYGNAAESVNINKQRKLIKTAMFYLTSHKLQEKCACRFDVLTLDGVPPKINWIKNAFGAF